jgi:hypothetical protein
MVTDEMNQQTKMQKSDNPAPVRTEAERKKWREEFFESMRNVPPERIAKIRAMIAPWPGIVAPREVEDKQD